MSDLYPQKIVQFRSQDASYSNDTWTFTLPEAIVATEQEEIAIEVINASIPYSFYGVNYANKYLNVTESEEDGSNPVSYLLTLTEGNYNAIQFLSLFQSAINSRSLVVGKSYVYSTSYDKFTNKATITLTSSNARSDFLFGSGADSNFDCEFLLGFHGGLDRTVTSSASLTSNSTMNMSPYEAVYIHSPNLGIVNSYETKTKNLSTILIKIPITSLPFSFIQWENTQNLRYKSTRNVIGTISFTLKDLDGDDIDIQNNNWYLSIKFLLLPKSDVFRVSRPDDMVPIEF